MKDKLKAFSIHLLISITIAALCLFIVYFIWNPAPLYKATGITDIFLLMLGIDIILGPVLTLIVYKKGKKTLKTDLIVIAILQLSALSYGMYHVFEGRPVWITYNVDRFDLVRANEIDTRRISEAKEEYQKSSITGAKYVAAHLPTDDIGLKNKILFDEIELAIAPSQKPELYASLETAKANIIKKSRPLQELNDYNATEQVSKVLSKYPEADSFVPLKANKEDMSVLINKKQGGKVVAIVDLRPWK